MSAPSGETPASSGAPGFQQRLGLFDSTMLVAGVMIGSGIFVVSADISRDVGSSGWLMVVWLLTGLMTVMGALSYAELAAMMPQAGGQYVYLRAAFGRLPAFLYGWTAFVVIQCGTIAAVAVAFSKFLGVLKPELGTQHVLFGPWPLDIKLSLPLPWMAEPLVVFSRESFAISSGQLVALVVIWALTLLNCRGVQEGKWVQNVFTVAKTLGLAMLIIVGLTVAASGVVWSANWQAPWEGIQSTARFESVQKLIPAGSATLAMMVVGGAMVGSLFSADAWCNITFTAGEIRNPKRNLPLSLIFGTVLVIGLYILCNLAYLSSLPLQGSESGTTPLERGITAAKDDRVGTAVLEVVSPQFGAGLMAVAIMISTFGCVNALILMSARLYYAMARDKLFFTFGGHLNSRGVPAAALVLQGVWSSLLVFSGTYSDLLDYVIFAALLFYALTVAGLFVLRRTQPDVERPYRVWGYPVVPALYVGLCSVIMVDLLIVKPVFTWPGLIIVLLGVPVYFAWRLKAKLA